MNKREIKFRYYHPNWGMSNPIAFGDWGKLQHNYDDGNVEVMEFTGLKDENGVEIYEGDIVERTGHKYLIAFWDGAFGLHGIRKFEGTINPIIFMYHGHALYNYTSELKVIGNKYQNSELLEKKSEKLY